MKNILFALGILVLVGCVMDASAATATNLVLDYDSTTVDSNLKPGDSGILTVVVKNTGGYRAENVQIWIPDTGDVHVSKRWYIGNIEPGASNTVTTAINVDANAAVGLKTLQARITYNGFNSDGNKENNKAVSWDIPLRVYGKANFQFNSGALTYTENTIGELRVNVNSKVAVREVTSTLTSSCTSIVGSGRQYLGDMTANKNYSIVYQIKPSQTGICPMTLTLDYYDASGNEANENASIGINVERSSTDIKIADIEDGSLALGSVSDITLKIKNLGNTPASDLTVTLNLTSPFTPVKSSQKYVGEIKPDETGDAVFSISVDSSAKKKSYSIPVTVEYYDPAGNKQTTSMAIGLSVGGNADIEVTLDEKETLVPGMTGKVTIGVVNRGFVDAKFLTIKLLSTSDYQLVSADSSYIGALNSDDSDSQDFEIKVGEGVTADTLPLKVRVEYKEENNDKLIVKEESINVGITSMAEYQAQKANGGVLSLVISFVLLIVVLVLGYLGIWTLVRVLGLATNLLDKKVFKRSQED